MKTTLNCGTAGRLLAGAAALVMTGSVLGLAGSPLSFYKQTNLVSDGYTPGIRIDKNLVNPMGLAINPTGFWRIASEGTGWSMSYDGHGGQKPFLVRVPTVGPEAATPVTGVVFNPTNGFIVRDGMRRGASQFIFATKDGTIAGWSPSIAPLKPIDTAHIVVDKSSSGAVYTGLAIAQTESVKGVRLYAVDFANRKIDMFDAQWQEIQPLAPKFVDVTMPVGYSPFGIQHLDEKIYVAYSMVENSGNGPIAVRGSGIVNVFDKEGRLLKRLVTEGTLDAPWGMAIAPADFGMFSGSLLIGNSGDGRISAFDHETGEFQGMMRNTEGLPIRIEGLWSLAFGTPKQAGSGKVLYFTAGPGAGKRGLFGSLEVSKGGVN